MNNLIKHLFALSLLALTACSSVPTHTEEDRLYSLPSHDVGDQSPINIFTFNTQKRTEPHKFLIQFHDEITSIDNLGHTVQLNFTAGSSITHDGRTYNIKQMHFHTPAEHLLDGITYPMELHIVSVNKDNPDVPHYLVVGLLFKMGKSSPFIDSFLNAIPKAHSNTSLKASNIKLRTLLSADDLVHNYHYKGSLTTPPYTETVNWFVLRNIFEASPEQIKAINAIESNNARRIAPKNNRVVQVY